jgi:hypothetical protein
VVVLYAELLLNKASIFLSSRPDPNPFRGRQFSFSEILMLPAGHNQGLQGWRSCDASQLREGHLIFFIFQVRKKEWCVG